LVRDPDAVLFDAVGDVSGTPGSVLVAGGPRIYAIRPDETTITLFDSSYGFQNVNGLAFDNSGRLIIVDDGKAFRADNGSLTTLFTTGDIGEIAIDAMDNIYARSGNAIIVFDSEGNVIDPYLFGAHAHTEVLFGPGGKWGTDLYIGDRVWPGGPLLQRQPGGEFTEVGTGFLTYAKMVFGPDRNLYVSDHTNHQILRISPIPAPSTIIGLLSMGLMGLVLAWRRRRAKVS